MAESTTFAVPSVGTPDRAATVARHAVRLTRLDPRAPLQVGNGEFAFAVDPTGLQTFPDAYPVEGGGSLLGTMAQWAWHSLPAPREYALSETMREYDTPHGRVPYVDLSGETHDGASQTDAEAWLRGNPHKLQLATIGLWTGVDVVDVGSLEDVDQRLDLWSGVIDSRFRLAGAGYRVRTAAHPERDAVAFEVTGPAGAPVGVRLRFPYGSDAWANASDWTRPEAHSTRIEALRGGWRIERRLDETSYTVMVNGDGLEPVRLSEHDLVIAGVGEARVVVEFSQGGTVPGALDSSAVLTASARGWEEFWSSGASVDLAGSIDPRALELERRTVLSQYLTAVNCAGSLPPAETGLLLNSWRGKSHLEMHPFHALHFAAWGRPRLLERSLAWYHGVLPAARATARRQGLPGARWPKQVGPDGREAPSSIGPFLVWQQPHLIYLLEMLYRAAPGRELLGRNAELVYDTAEFMAAFAVEDADGFHLGPPVVPAQESYAFTRSTARDPTFELAYWAWGLEAACGWRRRVGRPPPDLRSDVAARMAKPLVSHGTYAALATPPYLVRDDHPSMLAGYGFVPATHVIDRETMARTFDDAMADWDWESTWGWDYPVAAMTAARLGRPAHAVDALLLDRTKNQHLVNGHNRQTDLLPAYLPGNGGLLLAVALMVGGWDGSIPTPGFGGDWAVAHDGFVALP